MRLFSKSIRRSLLPSVVNIVDEKLHPYLDKDYSSIFEPQIEVAHIATSKTIEKIV